MSLFKRPEAPLPPQMVLEQRRQAAVEGLPIPPDPDLLRTKIMRLIVQGKTLTEIATTLECSVSYVSDVAREARKMAKQELWDYAEEILAWDIANVNALAESFRGPAMDMNNPQRRQDAAAYLKALKTKTDIVRDVISRHNPDGKDEDFVPILTTGDALHRLAQELAEEDEEND